MIHVSPAAATELPEAAAVLAEAFRDDPVLGALVGPGANRERRMRSLFEAMMRSGAHAHGAVDVARRDRDDAIVGVAAWEAPGAVPGALLRRVLELPRLLSALRRRVPQALLLERRLAAARPATRHWYLGQIGVAESARGLGVGGKLLEARLARIDREGVDAWLESSTPANRRLYARHGFVERGAIAALPNATPVGMLRTV